MGSHGMVAAAFVHRRAGDTRAYAALCGVAQHAARRLRFGVEPSVEMAVLMPYVVALLNRFWF